MLVVGIVLLIVIAPTPWYNAQYLIPLAGMLINNALTGLALALNGILDHLTSNRKEHVEVLLCFGATPWEASWPAFTQTIKQALIPAINGMNVIGIVSIPGMMTGQVLGGSSPRKAASYQVVITFLISGMTTLSVSLITALTIRSLFDSDGRLALHILSDQKRLKVAQVFTLATWKRCGASLMRRREARVALLESAQVALTTGQLPCVELKEEFPSKLSGELDPLLDVDILQTIGNGREIKAKFQLRAGEIACIMGESGIGKSTLLKIVSDLWSFNGHVSMLLRGRPSSEFTPQAWRQQVIYLHQMVAPLPGTPKDLVQTIDALKVNKGKPSLDPIPFLEGFGLSADFLTRPWQELSGGEKQRVMCSIAMSANPACILLDEPTSALDDASKKLVEERIQASDCAVLLVTHDKSQVKRLGGSVWNFVER